MKQVFFDGKSKLHLKDVPAPVPAPGQVLVRAAYSVISSGTESTALAGGGSLFKQAVRRPDLVQRTLRFAAQKGIQATVGLVRSAATNWFPLGYSAAGAVVEVGAGVRGFAAGERVACAGAGYANHAEFIAVPVNLTARVPERVPLRDACFATLGAIALQGVRRAEPTLGESVVVVGSGLIGLLTAQLLQANGCRVICTDLAAARLQAARAVGIQHTVDAGRVDPVEAVQALTGGVGADAVILAADTASSEPINQAFRMCRERGRVVVVGAVGMDLERKDFYDKEIDLRISRSYGPGRYNPNFEEKGLDYPVGYVRWTETRNLSAFLEQVDAGRVAIGPLISAEYPIERAAEAYARVTGGDAATVGVVLSYPGAEGDARPVRTVRLARGAPERTGKVGLALVGAGNFARLMHVPNLKALSDRVSVRVVVSGSGGSARQAAETLGAPLATTDLQAALADDDVDAVLIATRHDLHREQCVAAAQAGKHIFVEKPLGLTAGECQEIISAVETAGVLCAVGFNRRLSPSAQALHSALDGLAGPKQIICRVNAGPLPPTHWLLDPEVGGGRILGEGCHFFDLIAWLASSAPVSVTAQSAGHSPDDVAAVVKFEDGSLGTLIYSGLGDPRSPKERVEVLAAGGVAVLDDFRTLTLSHLPGKSMKLRRQDKGHRALLAHLLSAVQGKTNLAVTAHDGLLATMCAEAALRSLAEGRGVAVE